MSTGLNWKNFGRRLLAYDRAASENNWRLRDGYGALVAASLPALPLRLSTPVTAIDHGGKVVVVTRAGARFSPAP